MRLVSAIVISAFAAIPVACASGQERPSAASGADTSQQPEPEAEELQPASGTVGECTAASGDLLPCSISAECCAGYACGFDPGRSRVQRFCLPE
jgi:hypothetical protein